jgi:hypothetical protein
MEIVEVEWVDSQGYPGWHDEKEFMNWNDSLTCHSVGYLLRDEADKIVLVMSRSSVALDNGLVIPRVAIVKITPLAEIAKVLEKTNNE